MVDFFTRIASSRGGKVFIVALVSVVGFMLIPSRKPEARNAASRPAKLPHVSASVDGISNDRVLQQEVVSKPAKGYQPFRPNSSVEESHEVAKPDAAPAPRGKLVFSFEPEEPRLVPKPAEIPEAVFPPGLLIPCRLFNGIESNLAETPLIANVTADIRINGRVVVPKGSQLHGTVRADDHRSRVMTGSSWQLVTPLGKVLKVSGIGLTRDYDPRRNLYGANDGLAGIPGVEVRQGQSASKRFLAATGLAAVSKLSQQRTPSLFGDQVVASLGNSAMEGGASVANEYARMKLKEVEKNKPFIRVAAGTEFYLYTQQQIAVAQPSFEPGLSDALRERERLMDELRVRLRAQTEANAQRLREN